ncbi:MULTISPECIES: hypothetical protein [unclassified Paenibacillus]|nr:MULTISPECIES: hypothetical protein [unclassified Paenibacillus]QID16063.1 hypothetical protein CIC07_25375 [Paenibacillus sp. RUD330]
MQAEASGGTDAFLFAHLPWQSSICCGKSSPVADPGMPEFDEIILIYF